MSDGITRRNLLKSTLAALPAVTLLPRAWARGAAAANAAETAQSSAAAAATGGWSEFFHDDFSKLPDGWLTEPIGQLNSAIQENHWIAARACPHGAWSNGVADLDSWFVSSEDGASYMQQQIDHPRVGAKSVLITGDDDWGDYAVEALVKPLALDGTAGIAFRYHTNREYYAFQLVDGATAQFAIQHPIAAKLRVADWETIASAPFAYNVERYYKLRVEAQGSQLRAFIDSNKVLEISDDKLPMGKVGICADIPARFENFRVEVTSVARGAADARIAARDRDLAALRNSNPQPRLWKKFDTPGFGAGSSVRFGDLDGDGVPEMLIVQNIPTVVADAFDTISCLTAVTLDGKILWQSGRPDPRNGLLTNDNPVQIHDVDGDGRSEVVTIRDFKLQILDGHTGEVLHWIWMPKAPGPDVYSSQLRPYELLWGDSLAFVNVSGDPARRDILVKNRYSHFWIFNNKLEFLWEGTGQTGHFPFPYDVGGYDRIAIGYSLWDHTGKRLWTHDTDYQDHADSVAVGNFSGVEGTEPRAYYAASDEGFLMFDDQGNVLKQILLGHGQCSSIGKFRPDLPGLQYALITFHWNPGIVTFLDWQGNILTQGEPIHNGSKMLPVNWRGDGQELVLLSADAKYGGMIDGHLQRAVMFPDDGHPALCAQPIDLTGDARDEVIVWDQNSVWIYTQDRPFTGAKIYEPVRNPWYNQSNYSAIVSLPNWKDFRG
jgi:rhamnogalacturonan endolyase